MKLAGDTDNEIKELKVEGRIIKVISEKRF